MENNKRESLKKIKELVEEVKIAMLCTSHNKDYLHCRPMSTAQVDDDGSIWFFTDEHTSKTKEVEDNHQVCLAYSNPSKNSYISINGYAEIVHDQAKMKELYNPVINTWFPKGLNDPKLALLKVTPQQAEYWDSSSNTMVTLFQRTKAIVTGVKYGEGHHGKIEL